MLMLAVLSALLLLMLLAHLTGEVEFKEPGKYTWTPPAGVTEVNVVCIAGGGGAGSYKSKTFQGTAAGGGGEGRRTAG
jgi:hypothetical protein